LRLKHGAGLVELEELIEGSIERTWDNAGSDPVQQLLLDQARPLDFQTSDSTPKAFHLFCNRTSYVGFRPVSSVRRFLDRRIELVEHGFPGASGIRPHSPFRMMGLTIGCWLSSARTAEAGN
jgi:hypothetical protein